LKPIIAGAGIGGLVTAMFLHRKGVTCEIYERVPKSRKLALAFLYFLTQ